MPVRRSLLVVRCGLRAFRMSVVGPHAGKGVVKRMAVTGQQITHAEETVSARPALAAEA